MIPKAVIHLLSGGLDSTVLLYDLLNQKCNVHCVLFNYGQKHASRELGAARFIARFLGVGSKEKAHPMKSESEILACG